MVAWDEDLTVVEEPGDREDLPLLSPTDFVVLPETKVPSTRPLIFAVATWAAILIMAMLFRVELVRFLGLI